jgi:mitogen-activated protein kinase organizer 1
MGVGSFDATVRLWDTRAAGGKAMMTLSEARDSVSCVAVVEAEIWAGSVDGRVRVYDVRKGDMSVDVLGSEFTPLRRCSRNGGLIAHAQTR